MNRSLMIVCVLAVVGLGSVAMAVDIVTVPVGNVGNAADSTGYGGVDYEYRIGKYEVTNAQYAEFLNAVADVGDANGLYDMNMGAGWNDIGGISRSGSGTGGDPWVYAVRTNRGARPVNYVSWYDTLRFANWLTNGQPSGPQGNGTTETGSYTLTGATSVNPLPDHAALAAGTTMKWLLTSEDEWYKAAYYKGGGTDAGYWDYPIQSDTAPTVELPVGTDLVNGSANFAYGGYLDTTYYTTEVGAYDAKPSDSPYGTFDQGGNVSEWNEASIGSSLRGVRGGSFNLVDYYLLASARENGFPAFVRDYVGFRVSEVEPNAAADPPIADADGPYTIWVGDPLILNANHSTEGYYPIVSYMWDLDDDGFFETDAGDQRFFELDYEDVQDLGLAVGGMYDIHLKVTDSTGLFDTDSSSLRVTPEPATLTLLTLGGLAILRRRRRGMSK